MCSELVVMTCHRELDNAARTTREEHKGIWRITMLFVMLSTARCGMSYSTRWLTSSVVAAVTFKGTHGVAATLIYYNCRDEKWRRLVKNPGGWHYENIQRRTVGMEQPCGKTVIGHEAYPWSTVPSVCISYCKWFSCKLFSSGRKVNP